MQLRLLYFMLVIATSASAQSLLRPGTTAFEKKRIKDDGYDMNWYILKDTTRIQIGTVSTKVISSNKEITVVTQVKMLRDDAPWIDSTTADRQTLEPIHHSSDNARRDMVLDFGKTVTGFYYDKAKDKRTEIGNLTDSGYFDSNLYPYLLGWLPLREGYRQDIAIYDYNPEGKIGVIRASVTAVESGRLNCPGNGMRDVWVVTVTDEIAEGGVSRYYFDKADRRLLFSS